MKKMLIVAAGAVFVLAVGFFVLNSYIYKQKQSDPPAVSGITSFEDCVAAGYPVLDSNPKQCETPDGVRFISNSGSMAILTGELVCLPHRDTSGPVTTECAFGLLSDAGNYYRLRDADPANPKIVTVPVGTHLQVKGALTLKAHNTYQSIGTIVVSKVTEQ